MPVEKEKIRSERVPFKHSVMFGLTNPVFYGFAYDLSEEGIGIYCEELPKVGDRVVIEIMLDSEFIMVKGEVRWILQGLYGETSRAGILLIGYPQTLKNIYRRAKPTIHAKH